MVLSIQNELSFKCLQKQTQNMIMLEDSRAQLCCSCSFLVKLVFAVLVPKK